MVADFHLNGWWCGSGLVVLLASFWLWAALAEASDGNALEQYIAQESPSFRWEVRETQPEKDVTVYRIHLDSHQWRGHLWSHELVVMVPSEIRHRETAFLLIGRDDLSDHERQYLRQLARTTNSVTAAVTRIPNQPLYDGRVEDRLIAYTFERYFQSGDPTWPLLFPMVKGVIRAMDALEQFASGEIDTPLKRFVIGGASKRGWTTYLTAAVDRRIAGMAPMVFEMVNMKAQTAWAEKAFGGQSEKIRDYTELSLVKKMDHPAMRFLRQWVDPYAYRNRYDMPKLILLGTNDPYWVVDSARHYWDELPEPKWLHQTPNAGHDLNDGKDSLPTLTAWYKMLLSGEPLPRVRWSLSWPAADQPALAIESSSPVRAARLWSASSPDRDFRDARWRSQDVALDGGNPHGNHGNQRFSVSLTKPPKGYQAYFVDLELLSPDGEPYRLTSEVQVIPVD